MTPHRTTETGHQIGTTYLSRYWQQTYKVTGMTPEGQTVVVWSDGSSTTHHTDLDPRDTIVR